MHLLGGAWVLGVAFFWFVEDAQVFTTYDVARPDGPAMPHLGADCSIDSAQQYVQRSLGARKDAISATLCFLAARAQDGRMLVPYKIEDLSETERDQFETSTPDAPANYSKKWLMNEPYASEVHEYTERYAKAFTIPTADMGRLESLLTAETWELRKKYGVALLSGLFAIWAVSALIGWIVRGFMGIPNGRDAKPEPRRQEA